MTALAATSAAPLGCSRGGASDAVELRFWNGFTGPDGRTILRLVQQFNRENPDVRVSIQRMDWGTYYNKLFVAGIDGRSPEVFVSHASALGRMQRAGLLRPADDLFGDGPGRVPAGDFDPNVLAAITFDGRRYALPLDVHPQGMFYNKALFRRAGLDPEAPPTDRDSFLDAARRVGELPAQNGASFFGFAFTWLRLDCLTLMRQFGGRLLAEDGSPEPLTSPANVEALAFARERIVESGLAPRPEAMALDSFIGFRQGRIGMIFQGIFMLPELERQAEQSDLEFAGAPLPTLGVEPAAIMDSHALCLDPRLEGEKLEAARRFVAFLSGNSLTWATGGQVPARQSLRQTPEFAAMEVQSAFASQIPYGFYPPQVDFIFEFQTEFDLAVESVLRGTKPPAVALAAAQTRIAAARQRYIS